MTTDNQFNFPAIRAGVCGRNLDNFTVASKDKGKESGLLRADASEGYPGNGWIIDSTANQ